MKTTTMMDIRGIFLTIEANQQASIKERISSLNGITSNLRIEILARQQQKQLGEKVTQLGKLVVYREPAKRTKKNEPSASAYYEEQYDNATMRDL